MDNLEISSLYKLMILYMLDKADHPLKISQILEFMLDKEYTDYFNLQKIISELSDDQLIESTVMRNTTLLSITESGKKTRDMFAKEISSKITEEINSFFEGNGVRLRNEVSIMADYYRNTYGEYIAELTGKERDSELINIRLSVPTEKDASNICSNWYEKSQEIYELLMRMLQ